MAKKVCPRFDRRTSFSPRRSAFTLTECMIALAILGVIGAGVAQCTHWVTIEVARSASRPAALELAANILEDAQARPWEDLDDAWAARQSVPADSELLLPDGKVLVSLKPAASAPLAKRVTVEVFWASEPGLPPRTVLMSAVIGPRKSGKSGGVP
jgi:prepilin-type N-terminal cleavage/methylation domain-containing protein